MLFIISLCVTAALAFFLRGSIKKISWLYYLLAAAEIGRAHV